MFATSAVSVLSTESQMGRPLRTVHRINEGMNGMLGATSHIKRTTFSKFPACAPSLGPGAVTLAVPFIQTCREFGICLCTLGSGVPAPLWGLCQGSCFPTPFTSKLSLLFFQTFPSGSEPGRPLSHTQNFHDSK